MMRRTYKVKVTKDTGLRARDGLKIFLESDMTFHDKTVGELESEFSFWKTKGYNIVSVHPPLLKVV